MVKAYYIPVIYLRSIVCQHFCHCAVSAFVDSTTVATGF